MHDLDEFGQADFVRPVWARWVTRIMLFVCALLMMMIMASQPKIARTIEQKSIWLSDYLTGAPAGLSGSDN